MIGNVNIMYMDIYSHIRADTYSMHRTMWFSWKSNSRHQKLRTKISSSHKVLNFLFPVTSRFTLHDAKAYQVLGIYSVFYLWNNTITISAIWRVKRFSVSCYGSVVLLLLVVFFSGSLYLFSVPHWLACVNHSAKKEPNVRFLTQIQFVSVWPKYQSDSIFKQLGPTCTSTGKYQNSIDKLYQTDIQHSMLSYRWYDIILLLCWLLWHQLHNGNWKMWFKLTFHFRKKNLEQNGTQHLPLERRKKVDFDCQRLWKSQVRLLEDVFSPFPIAEEPSGNAGACVAFAVCTSFSPTIPRAPRPLVRKGQSSTSLIGLRLSNYSSQCFISQINSTTCVPLSHVLTQHKKRFTRPSPSLTRLRPHVADPPPLYFASCSLSSIFSPAAR